MIDFNDGRIVKKYPSWIKAQVAFYDFIFSKASQHCASCFNASAFADGNRFYEEAVKKIQELYPTPADAWNDFLNEGVKEPNE